MKCSQMHACRKTLASRPAQLMHMLEEPWHRKNALEARGARACRNVLANSRARTGRTALLLANRACAARAVAWEKMSAGLGVGFRI